MSLHAASGHCMLNYMSITGIVTCYYMLPWSITWTLHAALIHYMFKFIQWFLVMAAAAADAIALPARSARCRDRRGGWESWDSWDKQCLECPWCDSTIFEQSCQIQRYNQLDHQTKSWLMRNRSTFGRNEDMEQNHSTWRSHPNRRCVSKFNRSELQAAKIKKLGTPSNGESKQARNSKQGRKSKS